MVLSININKMQNVSVIIIKLWVTRRVSVRNC